MWVGGLWLWFNICITLHSFLLTNKMHSFSLQLYGYREPQTGAEFLKQQWLAFSFSHVFSARSFNVQKSEAMIRKVMNCLNEQVILFPWKGMGRRWWTCFWASFSVSLQHLEFRNKMNVDSLISDWKPPEVYKSSNNGTPNKMGLFVWRASALTILLLIFPIWAFSTVGYVRFGIIFVKIEQWLPVLLW